MIKEDFVIQSEVRRVLIRSNIDYAKIDFGTVRGVKGERERAEKHLSIALRLNSKYREALLNLGYLFLETGRFKRIEKTLLREARREPVNGPLYHLLALFYLQTGRKKEAVFHVRKAIRCQPDFKKFYKGRGVWRRGSAVVDDGLDKVFKRIYFNYPLAQFHRLMGLRLARKGRLDGAVQELKKAFQIHPDEFSFRSQLGRVYYSLGAYRKAIREYQKALKINPHSAMGYANLSFLYGLMRRTREALVSMKKAVKINPHYADLHYNLALLYSDRKHYLEAISELKKALRVNPNYLFARINLGVLYEEQQRFKEARREYRRILKVTPEDEHVRKRLEKISP